MFKKTQILFAALAVALALYPALAKADFVDDLMAVSTNTQMIAQFTNAIDDLPLMPGLTPQEDKDVVFTSGQDRIAQTTAVGSVDIDEVYQFYARTLPQLGWKKIDARTYHRDNEKLRIDVTGSKDVSTVVRFSVEPIRAD